MKPNQVWKWLRQQSIPQCCWFWRTGNAMEQAYLCWWRICREMNVFSRLEYHIFDDLYPFVAYLLTFTINMDTCKKYVVKVLNIGIEGKWRTLYPTIFVYENFHLTILREDWIAQFWNPRMEITWYWAHNWGACLCLQNPLDLKNYWLNSNQN
jgi:hypothetical protein